MAEARAAYSKVAAPKRLEVAYQVRWELFPYLMVVMLLLTTVSIFHVWSRVKVVDLNLQMAETKKVMKEQQQENSRLKLEVAALKTPARIETLAKGELGMAMPTDQQVIVVK